MTDLALRKLVTITDEVLVEMGQRVDPPTRRAAAIANPFAGWFQSDLTQFFGIDGELGEVPTRRALAALGIAGEVAESYGKAAILGEAGEIEHAAAILHPQLGALMRAVLGGGAALVPSAKKRGTMGTVIDVPLWHRNAAYVRSHFDAMEVSIPNAPRGNEILVAVVVTDNGRPIARVGGFAKSQIIGQDGLR
jgi:hypothetical protein